MNYCHSSLWCSNCLTCGQWEPLKQDSMASEWNPPACSVREALEPSSGQKSCCPSACTLTQWITLCVESYSVTSEALWISSVNAFSPWWPLHTRWLLPCRKPLSPSQCLPWSRHSSSLNSKHHTKAASCASLVWSTKNRDAAELLASAT